MTEPWEKAKVERVHLATGEDGAISHLGGQLFGDVYQGRLKLTGADGKRKNLRVAVKIFKNQEWANKNAWKYSRAIRDLRAEKLPLPKMFMHRLSKEDAEGFHGLAEKGDFVKVMELYGSRKGSKLKEVPSSPEMNLLLVEYATKAANAGYRPGIADCFLYLKGDVKLLDLDSPAISGKARINERAQGLICVIQAFAKADSNHDELLRVSLEHAKPELRARLKKLTAKAGWQEKNYD